MSYELPVLTQPKSMEAGQVALVASGDLRESANRTCWPAQQRLERLVASSFRDQGVEVVRAHPVDPGHGHGFISSQRQGMDVFQALDRTAPVIVAEAVWQYSHHVLAGLRSHRGKILTVANWEGQWPGLVGVLNLNASLVKAGREYSPIWSHDFEDDFYLNGIRDWLANGSIEHDDSHVRALAVDELPAAERHLGEALAEHLKKRKAILGVFDEGCMGMYNAIIDDELLNPAGIYKERLSQSALLAEMDRVADDDVRHVFKWLLDAGMTFDFGPDPETDLTEEQVRDQLRMYIAGLRIADEFGCDAIGIQYQQGLKDMAPASDLAEGLLNNRVRPPVRSLSGQELLFDGDPLPHFNEVDEGAGVERARHQQSLDLDGA